jgi:hypothetical protein
MRGLGRVLACAALGALAVAVVSEGRTAEGCVDFTADIAACQPSPFNPPAADIPSMRLNAQGVIDHKASDEDAIRGARVIEERLHLFRNFTHIHWVPLLVSATDPSTGDKRGGDIDGQGDGRGLAVSGNCIFVGHQNRGQDAHPVNILRIAADPVAAPPVKVGEIPAVGAGFDDRELRATLYTKANGTPTMLLMRNGTGGRQDGRLLVYTIDPATCLPTAQATPFVFGGEFHEFFMWISPQNPRRVLVVTTAWGGAGRPDPNSPGRLTPDIRVMAVTDENTGDMLPKPVTLATHTLQEVGGPVLDERPDENGLFSDGRFPDLTHLKDSFGVAIPPQTVQRNYAHSASMSADGERIYVAGSLAGFYILNAEGIARSRNADLAAGRAGCNLNSTNVYADGVIGGTIDLAKIEAVANDCLHMVINDDPSVKALLASRAPKAAGAYLALHDRSRWDIYPPVLTYTGAHSAVVVPERPSPTRGNAKQRPSYVVVSDENPFDHCPSTSLYIVNAESEISPTIHGTFALGIDQLDTCLNQPTREPNGEPRQRRSEQAHNPTVFKNLVFISWYGQGLRAIDISVPQAPREVGYAIPAPQGVARTYPVFRDGLIYWVDNSTGLHVARYTGPRANELPGPNSGVYEGNSTPHR